MKYPSRSSGWRSSLGALFLAVVLAVIFIYPQAVFGRKAEPVNKDDVIDALISVNIKGTYEDNRRQHVGSLTIIATGKIKNESKAIGLNQYVPEGMSATYHYEYREIDLDPPKGCPPLALEEQGSGSVKVVSVMAGNSDSTGAFLLQVFTGLVGKTNMLQFTKRAGPDTMTHLGKEPVSDNYMFLFAPVTMKITKKVRRKCPQYEYDEQDNKRVFALRVPFAELKQEKMSGSYSWQSKKFPYKNLGMEVTNLQGNITYKPKKEPGEVQYQVNWVFGKVKEIEILREVKKPKEDWKHITNKQEQIMVGEKIRLKAVVQPGEKPAPKGSWDIGETGSGGNVIKQYKADMKKNGEVIYLDPKMDLKQPEITFYLFKGEEQKVSYKTDEGKAETTLIINKPEYTLDIDASPGSTLKEVAKGAKLDENQCWVTSAYTDKTKLFGLQYDGIRFTCTLQDQEAGEIQWVQIIERETSRLKDAQGAKDDWEIQEALDICYPYQYGNKAKDAPAVFVPKEEPGVKTEEELIFSSKTQTNRMYLMFKPKQKESEWVPLKVIPWEWTGALQKTASQWDKEPVITKGPGNVTAQDATQYPVWTINAGDATKYKRVP